MIKIVHWKDIVGKDFLDQFVKIVRGVIIAEQNELPASEVLKKLSPEMQESYKTKRALMRKCGYEDRRDPSPHIWHGWYRPFFDSGEIRFWCTAGKEERKYIALPTFLEWKRTGNLEDDIDLYYETQDLIKKVANDEGGFLQ